jgi:hypothetical protein
LAKQRSLSATAGKWLDPPPFAAFANIMDKMCARSLSDLVRVPCVQVKFESVHDRRHQSPADRKIEK